jgi:hypothetical protein
VTVKGQLFACRETLMAGMRAISRGATPNPKGEKLLRACLDLVEHLTRQSADVKSGEVDTTLAVLESAYAEREGEAGATHAASVAIRNAIGRLRQLKVEMEAGAGG